MSGVEPWRANSIEERTEQRQGRSKPYSEIQVFFLLRLERLLRVRREQQYPIRAPAIGGRSCWAGRSTQHTVTASSRESARTRAPRLPANRLRSRTELTW